MIVSCASAIVADRFPYIPAAPGREAFAPGGEDPSCLGPSLLGLDELERVRDRMAAQVQELRHVAAERDEHERRAHEQLRQMRLEPGRYKFARYYAPANFNTPDTLEQILRNNDLQLFDLKNDPLEVHNLALDPEKNKDVILRMNALLNELMAKEVGKNDGSFLPAEIRPKPQ